MLQKDFVAVKLYSICYLLTIFECIQEQCYKTCCYICSNEKNKGKKRRHRTSDV